MQRIRVPLDVTPLAPAELQNVPALTTGSWVDVATTGSGDGLGDGVVGDGVEGAGGRGTEIVVVAVLGDGRGTLVLLGPHPVSRVNAHAAVTIGVTIFVVLMFTATSLLG